MEKYQSFINEKKGFECTDCGGQSKDFYVEDALWYQVIPEYKQRKVICIPCFEKRLGRKLKKSDFKIGWEHHWRERPDWDENYWNSLDDAFKFDPYSEEDWRYDEAVRWYNKGKLEKPVESDFQETEYNDFITDDEFRKFLIENYAYDNYIRNCYNRDENIFPAYINILKFDEYKRGEYIYQAFNWADSKEGSKFWIIINKKWENFIQKRFFEAVRWYNKGKWEKDDFPRIEKDIDVNEIRVGDKVVTKTSFYRKTEYGDINGRIVVGALNYTKIPQIVEEIRTNKYGEMIRLYAKKPWYVMIDWKPYDEKLEAVRWYNKGKLEEPEKLEEPMKLDIPKEIEITKGHRIFLDDVESWYPSHTKFKKYMGTDKFEYHEIEDVKHSSEISETTQGKNIDKYYNGYVFKIKGKWPWYKFIEFNI